MFYDYETACEATVTREMARLEIMEHDCEGWEIFLREVGDKTHYKGSEVLDWLGY